MAGKYRFLRQVPRSMIRDGAGSLMGASVAVPGDPDSANGYVRAEIAPDDVFPSTGRGGEVLADHFNVRMEAGRDVPVSYTAADGSFVRTVRSPEALSSAWQAWQDAQAAKRGPTVWLDGVPSDMVRESALDCGDGSGRRMLMVSVPDPDAVPRDGNVFGYGSFLVHPDCVAPSVRPGRLGIYLGRSGDDLSAYQVRTDLVDEDGRDVYRRVRRSAGDAKWNYDHEVEAFRAGMDLSGRRRTEPDVADGPMGRAPDVVFLRHVPGSALRPAGSGFQVSLPDGRAVRVSREQACRSRDASGNVLQDDYDVGFPAASPVTVYQFNRLDGITDPVEMAAADLRAEWEEYRESRMELALDSLGKGRPVAIRGVEPDRVRRVRVETGDGPATVVVVSVPDAESVPVPGEPAGYGLLTVDESCASRRPDGKYDVMAGWERSFAEYEVRTGGTYADGTDEYRPVPRTGGELGVPRERDLPDVPVPGRGSPEAEYGFPWRTA